ncbi:MAG: bifunctional phosphopantothenoylcysteine decarboxylase/phosphopantothenate--cysteine ligase CoaBC [Burkholderiaceae bacterium]
MWLKGKTIALGISGGIAAYKSAELVRLLKKAGAEVQVILTRTGSDFITPLTLQALSGRPVISDSAHDSIANGMAHIELARRCDAILLAPATANQIAKIAHGVADDLLSTLCLARTSPLWVAPAMNVEMWNNPATQRNVRQLLADGCQLFGPASGEQACGETGPGRMVEPQDLLESIISAFTVKVLANTHVLITAGPTYEAIDPVRGITNRSSGKMGYAVALAAARAGAKVTLISGPTSLACPWGVERINVTSAAEMLEAVSPLSTTADLFFGVAAVADWRVTTPAPHKIKKNRHALHDIAFASNPDILATVAALAMSHLQGKPFCIGFAAETEHLISHARQKLRDKNIPLIVGNLAQDTLGSDTAELCIIETSGETPLPKMHKQAAAARLIELIAVRYRQFSSQASP